MEEDETDLFDDVFGKDKEKAEAELRRQEKGQAVADAKKNGKAKPEKDSPETGSETWKTGKKSEPKKENSDSTKDDSGKESAQNAKKEKLAKPPVKKSKAAKKPAAEISRIEPSEHRTAIKKVLLDKASKAAEQDKTDDSDLETGELETEDESKDEKGDSEEDVSDSDEKTQKNRSGHSQEEVDHFLDDLDDDDWTREDGTQEEGIKQPGEAPAEKQKGKIIPIVADSTKSDVPLRFLEDADKKIAFIGRKKSVFKQFGDQASLFIGRVEEPNDPQNEKRIFLDSLNPHVVFVCGARGSGKSYVLGVIAEELATKNKDVGAIVVDPIGVFWSMRLPNREEKELETLGQWQLMPQGLTNLKVFIPRGIAPQVPKSTYDSTFAIQPSLLTVEDWCLTFGIERFSPTGLLLEKALFKLRTGFTDTEGKKIKGKDSNYAIDDLAYCLEKDSELSSRDKGFKQDSVRALVSRFESAKTWGIFDHKGTPLGELSRPGQLTVLDTSFLEDNVTALVIGVLARRILAARKISARKEAAKRLKEVTMDELLELDIPPTWLFIDEAHTLIPSGNVSTPATSALVEYVKQGRRPGCSLVFATQQPSAIDTRVLSQLDVLIAHKLVFDDDLKAVYKRAPTIIPLKYKSANFIKTLPVGVGLTADRREETSRAFSMRIRPRMSQHEGRDAETASTEEGLAVDQVENLASQMLLGKLEKEGEIELDMVQTVVDTLNARYKSQAKLEKILELLKKKKVVVTDEAVILPGVKKPDEDEEEKEADSGETDEEEKHSDAENEAEGEGKGDEEESEDAKKGESKKLEDEFHADSTELISFPVRVVQQQAEKIASSKRKGGILGFGSSEHVKSVLLKHEPIYRVLVEVPQPRNVFVSKQVFISSVSGEFMHFGNREFLVSKGVSKFWDLDSDCVKIAMHLIGKKLGLPELAKAVESDEESAKKQLKKLISIGVVDVADKGGRLHYFLGRGIDLPPSPMHNRMDSLSKVPFEKIDTLAKEPEVFSQKEVSELLEKMFPNIQVRGIAVVYRPFYEAAFDKNGTMRKIRIDALNGKIINGQ